MEKEFYIGRLIVGYLRNELRDVERIEFEAWLNASPENRDLFGKWSDEAYVVAQIKKYEAYDESRAKQLIFKKIDRVTKKFIADDAPLPATPLLPSPSSDRRVSPLRTTWFRYAAAVLIIVVLSIYFLENHYYPDKILQEGPGKGEILPGGNRAMLTLASGKTIILDSAGIGKLAVEEGVIIQKVADGDIVYSGTSEGLPRTLSYNTMSTPRGGQYKLLLPDGSRVWLNAASSITYPTVFSESSRFVTISGEVYFEVARNPEKPFIVRTYKDEIKVLGTSFNVNCYTDEPVVKTTLLEGSVYINNVVLKPGEAYINGRVVSADIRKDVAWKNGAFNFNNATVPEMMRQLGRWYDVEIVYEGEVQQDTFAGEMGRNLTLNEVLNALKDVGVKFKIEEKKLMIIK